MSDLIPSVEVSAKTCLEKAARIRAKTKTAPELEASVTKIVEAVRKGGEPTLLDCIREFDGAHLTRGELRVKQSELDLASTRIQPELASALRFSLRRIRSVQSSVIQHAKSSKRVGGFTVLITPRPLPSVGCYVPGGRALYASTVLMTAGVAKLAGVERVVVCSPADRAGRISDSILAAARLAGVDEFYKVGGAQAIAAMAYGTESIRPVQKIVGPGGQYVSAAKKAVTGDVEIDFHAGPTELVVLADDSCEPKIAAWDLVGQAEHGDDSLCGLVTYSEGYANRVRTEIRKILPKAQRSKYVRASLGDGFAAICEDEETACGFVNAIAPEHLEILISEPERAEAKIHGAGLKLLGEYSPCAVSDYSVGTDHVIPTAGVSSRRGCLSALDFMKLDWSVRGSREGLRRTLRPLKALAYAEGLPNHYLSVNSRFVS